MPTSNKITIQNDIEPFWSSGNAEVEIIFSGISMTRRLLKSLSQQGLQVSVQAQSKLETVLINEDWRYLYIMGK